MADSWKLAFTSNYGEDYGHDRIAAVAEFQGDPYVGLGRLGMGIPNVPVPAARVHHLQQNACKAWHDVSPALPAPAGPALVQMAVFGAHLYLATDSGQVWRSTYGKAWTKVASGLTSGAYVHSMVVFMNHLYVSTGADNEIWRTADGTTWKPVVGASVAHPAGFGDIANVAIRALGVLGNYLYAGVSKSQGKGIEVWRTQDGVKWIKFKALLPDPKVNVGVFPGDVQDLANFGGKLYISVSPGDVLYRTDGSASGAGHWEKLPSLGASGNCARLAVYDKTLYLGLQLTGWPTPAQALCYASADGAVWKPATGCPVWGGATARTVTVLYGGASALYLGAENPAKQGKVELWELSPAILPDDKEPNNTIDTATPVSLGLTQNEVTVSLHDLTLHDAQDQDYFCIDYQSDATQECPGQAGGPPYGGSYGLAVHPATLVVTVQEAYCQPLQMDAYDAQKKYVPALSATGTVYVKCPTATLKGKRLYVCVKPSPGKAPLRYTLAVTFTNSFGEIILPKIFYRFWEVQPPPYPPPPFAKWFDPLARYFDWRDIIGQLEEDMADYFDLRERVEEAEWRLDLGRWALLAGRSEQAEALLPPALEAFQELGIPAREAEAWRAIGQVHAALERLDGAVECHERAARLHQRLEDRVEEARDRLSLGQILLFHEAWVGALEALGDAAALLARAGPVDELAWSLLGQGDAFAALQRREAALACWMLAQGWAARGQDPGLSQQLGERGATWKEKWGEKAWADAHARAEAGPEEVRYEAMHEVGS